MKRTRIPSPARSLGPPRTPRQRHKPSRSTRSEPSPARATGSRRLPTLAASLREEDVDGSIRSSLGADSLLTDNTDIEVPRRKSWWKKLDENYEDVMEVVDDNKEADSANILEGVAFEETLTQERANLVDITESTNESSASIPPRRLFKQPAVNAKKNTQSSNTSNVVYPPKEIDFAAVLLNSSGNATAKSVKDRTMPEARGRVRNLFGKQPSTKRKNMFTAFLPSESEEEIPEVQPRVFGFHRQTESRRRASSKGFSYGSPASSIDLDDWRMLPSSTMMVDQLENMVSETPVKRIRLSNISKQKVLDSSKEKVQDEPNKSQDLQKNASKITEVLKNVEQQMESLHRQEDNNKPNGSKQLNDVNVQDEEPNEDDGAELRLTYEHDADELVEENQHDRTDMKVSDVESVLRDEISEVHNENKSKKQEEHNKTLTEQEKSVRKSVDHIRQSVNQEGEGDACIQDGEQAKEDDNNKVSENEPAVAEGDDQEQKNKSNIEIDDNINQSVVEEQKDEEAVNQSGVEEPEDEEAVNQSGVEEPEDEKAVNQSVAEEPEDEEAVDQSVAEEPEDEEAVNQSGVEEPEDEEAVNQSGVEEPEDEKAVNQSGVEEPEDEEAVNQSVAEEPEDEEAVNQSAVEEPEDDEKIDQSFVEKAEDEEDVNQSQAEEPEDEEEVDQSHVEEPEDEDEIDQSHVEEPENVEEVDQSLVEELEDDEEMDQSHVEEPEDEDEVGQSHVEEPEDEDEVGQSHVEEPEDDEEMDQSHVEEDEGQEEVNHSGVEEPEDVEEMDQSAVEEPEDVEEINQSVVKEPEDEEEEDAQDAIDESPNVTHDTTGRNRAKPKSPEALLTNKSNHATSFAVTGRNTSIRKTMVRPELKSLAPIDNRDSIGTNGSDSSAQGSGWDSHRNERKTLRQTFGRDFTPRKSLRALVMEKSAKRQAMADGLPSNSINMPQANSTEMDAAVYDEAHDINESGDESSKRDRRKELQAFFDKLKQDRMAERDRIREKVHQSLRMPRLNIFTEYKINPNPKKVLKPAQKKVTRKHQLSDSLLADLPLDVQADLKYKPPKRFNKASWCTKRLYNFLETKLEPKYDYKARVRAEKLVEEIFNFGKLIRKERVAPQCAIDRLKQEMARLNIVRTHFDFYNFFREFLPKEMMIKVIPDTDNKLPLPGHMLHSDILPGRD